MVQKKKDFLVFKEINKAVYLDVRQHWKLKREIEELMMSMIANLNKAFVK